MRRTGRVIIIFCIIVGCMAGLWLFQSWRTSHVAKKTTELHNVYVTGVQGISLQGIQEGKTCQWELLSEVTAESVVGVADLVLEDDKVVKIQRKPEMVQGTVKGEAGKIREWIQKIAEELSYEK